MATFNVVVSDPETGRSYTREVEGQDANRFMGREIGDEVDGTAVGLEGFTLEIRGGSDDAGRPMRGDVRGPALKEILLEGGVGYEPNRDGERKRVTVRGREVSEAIAQLNVAVVEGEGWVPVALGEAEPEDFEDMEPEADEESEAAADADVEEADEAAEEDASEEADAEEADSTDEEPEEGDEEADEDDETTDEDGEVTDEESAETDDADEEPEAEDTPDTDAEDEAEESEDLTQESDDESEDSAGEESTDAEADDEDEA